MTAPPYSEPFKVGEATALFEPAVERARAALPKRVPGPPSPHERSRRWPGSRPDPGDRVGQLRISVGHNTYTVGPDIGDRQRKDVPVREYGADGGTFSMGKRFEVFATRRHNGGLREHTFVVEVELNTSALSGPGFVCDSEDLSPLGDYLNQVWQNRTLDDVVDWSPTNTALARHLADWFRCHVEPGLPATLTRLQVQVDSAQTFAMGRWHFAASHSLPSLPVQHRCHGKHEHRYRIDVDVTSGHGTQHLLLLHSYISRLCEELDSSCLNLELDVEPTLEHLAAHIGRMLGSAVSDAVSISAVRVTREDGVWAEHH